MAGRKATGPSRRREAPADRLFTPRTSDADSQLPKVLEFFEKVAEIVCRGDYLDEASTQEAASLLDDIEELHASRRGHHRDLVLIEIGRSWERLNAQMFFGDAVTRQRLARAMNAMNAAKGGAAARKVSPAAIRTYVATVKPPKIKNAASHFRVSTKTISRALKK